MIQVQVKKIYIYNQTLDSDVAVFDSLFKYDERKAVCDFCRNLCLHFTEQFLSSTEVVIEYDHRTIRMGLFEFLTIIDFAL